MARTILAETTDEDRLDTNVYGTITGSTFIPVTPEFGSTSTKAAGIVKLVNIFTKLLYTLKGSNFLNKEEGTNYLNIFYFNVYDEVAAFAKVQDAIDDASEQIAAIQATQGVPSTEKLRQVLITSLSISDARELLIVLSLEVASGNQTTVQLPSVTLENT